MINAQQIRVRLENEKDPLQYIDGEVSRCASQMGDRCGNIQDTISLYNGRKNKDDQIDMQKLKDDLVKMGELYWEMNLYVKARKEQARRQKRAEQVNKAQSRHQKRIEQNKMLRDKPGG